MLNILLNYILHQNIHLNNFYFKHDIVIIIYYIKIYISDIFALKLATITSKLEGLKACFQVFADFLGYSMMDFIFPKTTWWD